MENINTGLSGFVADLGDYFTTDFFNNIIYFFYDSGIIIKAIGLFMVIIFFFKIVTAIFNLNVGSSNNSKSSLSLKKS